MVWEWKASKEVARQTLAGAGPACLTWSDSTTVITAGSGSFKVSISSSGGDQRSVQGVGGLGR